MRQTKEDVLDKQYKETISRFIDNLDEHIDSRGDIPYEEILSYHMASIFRMALIVTGYDLAPELRSKYIEWAEKNVEDKFIEACKLLDNYDSDETPDYNYNLN